MLSPIILLTSLGLTIVSLYFAATSQTRRWIRWTAAGVSIVLLLSVLLFFVPPQPGLKLLGLDARAQLRLQLEKEQTSLDQHRAMWEAKQPNNYVMTVHKVIFCPANDCPVDEYARVETLFARAQEGINQGCPVTVVYDPELGYPTRVMIDRGYHIAENGFVELRTDQGITYVVTSFQIQP